MGLGIFLLLPLASGITLPGALQEVNLDLFKEVQMSELVFTGGCGARTINDGLDGQFLSNTEDRWFRFTEGNYTVGGQPVFGGEIRTNCGTATLTAIVPPGTHHIHIRFDADRRLTGPAGLDQNFTQTVTVRTPAGVELGRYAYFATSQGAQERQSFEMPTVVLGTAPGQIVIEWYFEDLGAGIQQGFPNPLSGTEFSATVWEPEVEFSGATAAIVSAHDGSRRQGSDLLREMKVGVEVPSTLLQSYAPNLRIRADAGFEWESVRLSNGTLITASRSFSSGERYSPNLGRVVVEHRNDQFLQITIPGDMLQKSGPGVMEVHMVSTLPDTPVALFIPLNALLLLAPLALGALSLMQVRAFQREAFGRFASSARNLLVAVSLVLAYYVAVVAAAYSLGWVELMSIFPLRLEAIILYVQVLLALAAFGAFYLVGRELYKITRPA